jgi:redox-sensitive bicupin YhaK (pirin superfamily)
MSAGTGIFHSEFNFESEDTTLYQIWIEPNKLNATPRWDAHEFPREAANGKLSLLVSGDGTAPLQINQDATIHAGHLTAGSELEHAIKHQAYLLVSKGEVELDGKRLQQGDGAEIVDIKNIKLSAISDADVLLIDVPQRARH